jgi:putative membrane protein
MSSVQIEPYCGSAPAPNDLLFRWNMDPVLLAVLGLIGVLLWQRIRAQAAHGSRTGRHAGWEAALLMVFLFVAFVSPLCALSSALFSARAIHHVILISLAAPLAARLLPEDAPLLDRIPSWASFVAHTAILWAWHLPAPYQWALTGSGPYWIMELPLLVTAVLLWRDILNPRRVGIGLGVCAGTLLQMSLLGAILAFASTPLFAPHFLTTEPYGLSPLEDQQLAGLLMWVPASIPYVAAFLFKARNLIAGASSRTVIIP